ncbi:MAG: hypothetical protein RR232_06110 [Clostridia bacterium]
MLNKKIITVIALLLTLLLCGSTLAASISAAADAIEPEALSTTVYITIVNDSTEFPMENIVISNAYNIAFNTSGVTIGVSKNHTFSSVVMLNEQIMGKTLTFEVSWYENGELMHGTASAKIEKAANAAITATRTASNKQASPGDTITLTYTVTNTGSVGIRKVSLTDKEIAGSKEIFKDISIAPGETYSLPYEYKMGHSTVTSQPVVTYTIDGQSTSHTFNGISALVLGMINAKLTVDVAQGQNTESGVTFTVTLVNNGNQSLKSIRVKDELGNAINSDSFSLAIGESRTLTYTVKTDDTRYVVFYISGYTGSDETYEDKTKSYTVRKYIDPSMLGITFHAEVTQPLNADGSIGVRFTINNTGSMDMKDLVLSETQQGELKRIDTVPPGEHLLEQTVYVGEPRDLVFTLNMADPAGNPYTYTANITANYVGVAVAPVEPNNEQGVETLGENLGASVTNTLRALFIVLIILTVIAGVAYVALSMLEKQKRAEFARKRAMRDQHERQLQRRAQTSQSVADSDLGNTRSRTMPQRRAPQPRSNDEFSQTRRTSRPVRRTDDDHRPDPTL